MRHKLWVFLAGFLLIFGESRLVFANGSIENSAPTLGVIEKIQPGELVLKNGAIEYQAWQGNIGQDDRTVLVIHFAARINAKSDVDALRDRIAREQYNNSDLRVITIADFDNALWGTKMLAASELKDNKLLNPDVSVVRDDNGVVRSEWSLPKNSLFVALFSESGDVLYQHLGGMTELEMNALVIKINNQIEQ